VSAADQFRDAVLAHGLNPPDVIEPGRFHKFPGIDKGPRNKGAWCKLFDDQRGGAFGDYPTGLSETWQAKQPRPYTPPEREVFRRQVAESKAKAEAERKAQHEEAARVASERWNAAQPADSSHPYLVAKGVQAHGIKQEHDCLVIPMHDASGKLCSVQSIAPDGQKLFLQGAAKRDAISGLENRMVCSASPRDMQRRRAFTRRPATLLPLRSTQEILSP
jgi:putative DNA primase/helicase